MTKKFWLPLIFLAVLLVFAIQMLTPRAPGTAVAEKRSSFMLSQRIRRELTERALEHMSTVEDIDFRSNQVTAKVNTQDWKMVKAALDFTTRTLEGGDAESLLPAEKAELLYLNGAANNVLKHHHLSIPSFTSAVANFKDSLKQTRDPDLISKCAHTLNMLSCVLAENGRFAEAEGSANEALQFFSQLESNAEFRYSAVTKYASTLRSLAIIAELSKKPALDLAETSLRVATELRQQLTEQEPIEKLVSGEFIVDGHLLLALLHARAGNNERTLAELQLSLEKLAQVDRDTIDAKESSEILIPLLPIRRRRLFIEQQIAFLKQHIKQPESAGEPIDLWVPMRRWPSLTLHSDLLFKGTMPPEFSVQDSIALTWRDNAWVTDSILETVVRLSSRVHVHVLAEDEATVNDVYDILVDAHANTDNISVHSMMSDSVWIRDYGPLTSVTPSGRIVFIDGIYGPCEDGYRFADETLPERMASTWRVPLVRSTLIIQGGELLVNGAGVCVASTSLLLNNVLRGIPEEFVIENLKNITGAETVIFLDSLDGEPTGHLDWFTTFPSATTVLIGQYSDPTDPNTALLDRNAERLQGVMTSAGPLNVVRIPMPPRQETWFGGSYTNVVYANGLLLLPIWEGDTPQTLERVKQIYSNALPDWEIMTIQADRLGKHDGALHCITVNLPHLKNVPSRGSNAGSAAERMTRPVGD